VEFIRQPGEHRTAFVRRYFNTLGREGWELVSVHPLGRWETGYYAFKRAGLGEAPTPPAGQAARANTVEGRPVS
jgi:hypothetical protein